ncbi:MAG: DUF3343 domain-containing protein [Oscillospiraceae bacterium]|nr:DUF3343 domain-containing protein [Oscillospiraceae bacterium]
MERFIIAVFADSKTAMAAQQALTQAKIYAPVMPTPRELTDHCGLSLRFPPASLAQVKGTLEGCGLREEEGNVGFYRMEYDAHSRIVAPIA